MKVITSANPRDVVLYWVRAKEIELFSAEKGHNSLVNIPVLLSQTILSCALECLFVLSTYMRSKLH